MAETINMPKLGFDMAEGLLVRWVRQVGETINKGDVLAEIETDKATVEVESSASGVVLQHIVDQGTIVPVNAPIAVVGAEGEKVEIKTDDSGPKTVAAPPASGTPQTPPTPVSTTQASAPAETAVSGQPSAGPVKASPLAKKIARDNNVNIADIQGSGPNGRIVRKDVEAALAGAPTVDSGPQTVQPSTVYRPQSVEDKVVPTTKLRQAIGRRLVESKQTIPHFYVTHEYKMDTLMECANKPMSIYLTTKSYRSMTSFSRLWRSLCVNSRISTPPSKATR
jgi:pyruvate dehydrogenase E2 component (dihydrolipoamide acetyltransferase)